jgi:ABC-type multidrug transport system ATPase subunit
MLNAYYITKRYGILATVDGVSSEARPGRINGFLGRPASLRRRPVWRRNGA